MLKINQLQMRALEKNAQRTLEDEMVSHIKRFAPQRCEALDDEHLRLAARSGIHRAVAYGFTKKGPIRLFMETMLLFGSHFDTDPQYPAISSHLGARGDQMVRAECIYNEIVAYQSTVQGEGGGNLRGALAALIALTRSCGARAESSDASMQQALSSSFPQKAAYVGEEGLQDLIRRGREEARGYGLVGERAQTSLLTVMFAFGHGVSRDWSYPAIEQALTGMSVRDTSTFAERFEAAALSLLEWTLENISKAAQQ
jgi:hypothetical protein